MFYCGQYIVMSDNCSMLKPVTVYCVSIDIRFYRFKQE